MTDTATRPDERTRTSHGDGDHDKFAHIVDKESQMRGYVLGEEIVALCGKVWVPADDPERLPVCPTCKEVLARLRAGGGEPR